MSKYVLIDGENFVHKLIICLRNYGAIKSRNGLKKIDVRELFSEKSLSIRYYATSVALPAKNHSLYKKMEDIRRWNSVWVPYLLNQGIEYIKAGSLRVRDGKKCANCGRKTNVLLEKGVDVRLAIDLVDLFKKGDEVFLLSSDTDLVPAIDRAIKKSVKITYVAFDRQAVKLISKKTTKTVYLKKAEIMRAYRKAQK